MANNKENLIPQNKRTKKEQREIATKGGVASGVARAKKKKLKDIAKMMLSCEAPKELKEKLTKKFPELAEEYLTAGDIAVFAQLQKAVKGDTRAFESIRDTAGEKPVDKHEDVTPKEIVVASNKDKDILEKI